LSSIGTAAVGADPATQHTTPGKKRSRAFGLKTPQKGDSATTSSRLWSGLVEWKAPAVLDGELVALDEDGKPDFPELCGCVLMRQRSTPLTFMAFDVLSVEGEPVVSRPCSERRRILEDLGLDAPQWRTPEAFDDGEALWTAVVEHELEGVVAKRRSGRYVPGGRGWVKTKNRDYWRYEMEREGAMTLKREHQFV
jgi:bifunctional non-homologous end joining protein LigD